MNNLKLQNINRMVWMFQAFQVPFVLYIAVLLFVTLKASSDKELHFLQLPQSLLLGIAFTCNLAYLLFQLLYEQGLITVRNISTYILLFDIMTSSCFIIAFINWWFATNAKKERLILGGAFTLKKVCIVSMLSVAFFVFARNFDISNSGTSDLQSHFTIDLYIFDFLAYSLIAYFMFAAADIHQPMIKDNTAKYFLASGFFLWAILHPLILIVIHFNIDVWGFGLSTFAKICIIYGFTSFFINTSRDTILKRNFVLEENSNHLTKLQGLTSEISNENDLQKLERLVIRHLHECEIFKYDYIAIFKVDHLRRKLVFRDSFGLDFGLIANAALNTKEDVYLEEDNIRTKCIRENKISSYISNSENLKSLFEIPEKCYPNIGRQKEYEKCVVWTFVPLNDSTNVEIDGNTTLKKNKFFKASFKKMSSEQKVIGLLQIGLRENVIKNRYQPQRKNPFLVEHYAKNLGTIYSRISEESLKADISGILSDADKRSGDDEHEFLSKLFENICKKTHIDRGFVALLSLDVNNYINEVNTVFYQAHSIKELLNTEINSDWIKSSEPFMTVKETSGGSELRIILEHEGNKYGVAHLYSDRRLFFIEDNASILFDVFGKAGRYFMEKKFHHAIASLSESEIMTTEDFANMRTVIKVIQKYFRSSYVSIWTMEKVKTQEFHPSYFSSDLQSLYKFYQGRAVVLHKDYPFSKVLDLTSLSSNDAFAGFGKRYGMVSIVTVPMAIDGQLYGFINIYSRRTDFELFDGDLPFLKLVANRCMVSLVTSEMIRSFSEITESLVIKPRKTVLEEIAKLAQKVLHCDPVLLFPLKSGQILFDSFIYFGTLKDERKVQEGRAGSFIETILIINDDQFYDSESDLPAQYEQNGHFWRREGIRSMAVSILKYKSETIGVMFFNYRTPRTFSPLVKQLVKTFASFAATAIINARNVETILDQRKALEEKAKFVESKNAEIMDKMERMLPVANAKSLAEIVRAVNHDIRNHLNKIYLSLLDIQENSLNWIKSATDRAKMTATIAIIEADINNSTNLIALFEPNSFRVTIEDIFNIAQKVANLFADLQKRGGASIKVTTKLIAKSLPDMRCVKAEISMIIYNLITNARNAVNEKWVKAGRPVKNPIGVIDIGIDFDQKEKTYIITVEDDGIGIDSLMLENIYEAGYTTRPGRGLGIGLYFVKETVEEAYRGTVICNSAVDRGTFFELRLKQHK